MIKPPMRLRDAHGAGYFGAPRGDRKHNGVDLSCYPDSKVLSICRGRITKFGYPYANHLEYRYVEVTDAEGLRYRYFYVYPNPNLIMGGKVLVGDVLGLVQDLTKIYPGITNHVHFEIKDKDNEYIDPTDFI